MRNVNKNDVNIELSQGMIIYHIYEKLCLVSMFGGGSYRDHEKKDDALVT